MTAAPTRGARDGVAKAVEAVRAGEIVVLPTDTVYGVGADAFSAEAVASLLAAKGRGREMPPPVLVPSVRTVDGLATDVPAWARDLIREFWPGPLTLVFKAQSSLMWDLGETNGTVALRMPQDDIALAVLTEVGPMAVTSANLTGQPPATRPPTPPPSWARPSPSTSTAGRPRAPRCRRSWTARARSTSCSAPAPSPRSRSRPPSSRRTGRDEPTEHRRAATDTAESDATADTRRTPPRPTARRQ